MMGYPVINPSQDIFHDGIPRHAPIVQGGRHYLEK